MCNYKYRAMALKYLIHLLTKFSFTENVSWVYIKYDVPILSSTLCTHVCMVYFGKFIVAR